MSNLKLFINAPFLRENRNMIITAADGCEVTENSADADIIIGELPEKYSPERLKFLQLCVAGAEKYCLENAEYGFIMANATGAFGAVISEYILGAVLAVYRGFFTLKDNQRRHLWNDREQERMIFGERTLILGCGDIGQNTAIRLKAFGADVAGIRRTPRPVKGFDEVYGIEALDEQLRTADIVICCLPKTPHTNGLLDSGRISLMKQNALVVNVGRGSLIDTAALYSALKNGGIYGAVLDVFEEEPLPENSPLWDLPNLLITPHISGKSFGHSPDTERRIAEICADNLRRFIDGKPLRNVVDKNEGYAVNCRE